MGWFNEKEGTWPDEFTTKEVIALSELGVEPCNHPNVAIAVLAKELWKLKEGVNDSSMDEEKYPVQKFTEYNSIIISFDPIQLQVSVEDCVADKNDLVILCREECEDKFRVKDKEEIEQLDFPFNDWLLTLTKEGVE